MIILVSVLAGAGCQKDAPELKDVPNGANELTQLEKETFLWAVSEAAGNLRIAQFETSDQYLSIDPGDTTAEDIERGKEIATQIQIMLSALEGAEEFHGDILHAWNSLLPKAVFVTDFLSFMADRYYFSGTAERYDSAEWLEILSFDIENISDEKLSAAWEELVSPTDDETFFSCVFLPRLTELIQKDISSIDEILG